LRLPRYGDQLLLTFRVRNRSLNGIGGLLERDSHHETDVLRNLPRSLAQFITHDEPTH